MNGVLRILGALCLTLNISWGGDSIIIERLLKADYSSVIILWDFNTDQVFTIKRDPNTGKVHYQIQKFKGLNRNDPDIVIATSD